MTSRTDANNLMFEIIEKSDADWRVSPNLRDYDALCRSFDWPSARRLLAGLPGGGLNIAHEAVTRHVLESRGAETALRHVGRDGTVSAISFSLLDEAASRFANVLESLVLDAAACRRPGSPSGIRRGSPA